MNIKNLAAATLITALAAGSALAADTFPSKPVRIIVPYSPGGATDVMTRLLGERMASRLNQPVVVENKPGAGTIIASEYVARAPADGYTLLMATSSLGIAPSISSVVKYDPIKDFAPISLVASPVHVLVVNADLPVQSVQELVSHIKKNPGKISYATAGVGTSTHLEAELFKSMAGIDMLQVPYKGSAPALTDLAAGRVQVMFDAWASSGPFVKSNRLRALAVTTSEPSKSLPELPTVASSGLPGFSAMPWFGIMAPAGTPPEIVQTLEKVILESLAEPALEKPFADLGLDIIATGASDFGRFVAQDVKTWAKVARDANIKLDE